MKKNEKTLLFIYTAFALIGLIIIMCGIFHILSSIQFKRNAVKITATISNMQEYRDSDGDKSYRVYVDYSYGGENYVNKELSFYSINMYIGKSVPLYVDPQNPNVMQSSTGITFMPLLLIGMGIIFTLIGMIPLVILIKKHIHKKNLIANGRCIYGIVDRVEQNTSYSVNGQHPYVVYCTYEDEYNHLTYRFKSDNIWDRADNYIYSGDNIRIYVHDNQDYSKYYVDTTSLVHNNQKIIDYT